MSVDLNLEALKTELLLRIAGLSDDPTIQKLCEMLNDNYRVKAGRFDAVYELRKLEKPPTLKDKSCKYCGAAWEPFDVNLFGLGLCQHSSACPAVNTTWVEKLS